jgi:hypothetical protein
MIDDELLKDAEEDAREAEFILAQLPSELKERFSKDTILAMMDYIVEYYYDHDVFDSSDEEIEIDIDEVADYVSRQAAADGLGDYAAADVFFVVQADLDYQLQD